MISLFGLISRGSFLRQSLAFQNMLMICNSFDGVGMIGSLLHGRRGRKSGPDFAVDKLVMVSGVE